jgi:transcriptional regulator with XRE-family HTH domain
LDHVAGGAEFGHGSQFRIFSDAGQVGENGMEAIFAIGQFRTVARRSTKEDMRAIAERLLLLREALDGVDHGSQTRFARRIGMDNKNWSTWETGKGRINVDGARQVSRRLGVSLDWIYDGLHEGQLPADIRDKLDRRRRERATEGRRNVG